MSNQVRRPPLRGMIMQGDRIVGGLDLPEPIGPFVEHFNREYAQIGLRVELPGSACTQHVANGRQEHLEVVASAS